MRLFIAINISGNLKKEVVKIQKQIKSFEKINLIPKENLHLTIKFLGEVIDEKPIIEKLNNIHFKEFNITSNEIGLFPNKKYVNVIWIGFKKNEAIIELKKKIDNSLSEFKNDFNFTPHLTIARVNYISSDCKKNISNIKIYEQESQIKSFKLVKSTLTSNGPIYKTIKIFNAKGL